MTDRLHPEDIEAIAERLTQGGATITVQDPRVSSVNRWLYTVFGATFTGVGLWLVASVNTLNVNVERLIVQMASQQQQTSQRFTSTENALGDLSDRIKDLERTNARR